MRILAIETATDVCSVAILDGEDVVAELMTARPRSHAEFLVPMVDQSLRLAKLHAEDLDTIAVSMGPGSYTGLRIGVSAAKGLAFSTGADLVGVPSLEALAVGAAVHIPAGEHILTAFGARRDEVYVALWQVQQDVGESGPTKVTRVLAEAALPVAELGDRISGVKGVLNIAEAGTTNLRDVLKDARQLETWGEADRRSVEIRHLAIVPAGRFVGLLGRERLAREGPADLASFEPFYLKEFVARTQEKTIFERLPF